MKSDIKSQEDARLSISKVVQLSQPTQVNCTVAASCDPSPATYLETTLEYPGGRTIKVSRTMASPFVSNHLRNGASLFLPAGTYVWTTRLATATGAPVNKGDIQSFDPILLGDPVNFGYIGSMMVAGALDGFFLVSAKAECQIQSKLEIRCQLTQGETLSSALIITRTSNTDPNDYEMTQSFPATVGGPNTPYLSIEAAPYFLRALHTYKFQYSLSPQPPNNGVCIISANG